MSSLALDIGRELRHARLIRGWTLKDVSRISGGRFKPSAVGGYERGERAITVERFCDIALLYGVPPEILLAAVLEPPGAPEEEDIVIDLTRLDRLQPDEREAVEAIVGHVSGRRAQTPDDRISLRWGDVVVLAEAAAIPPADLIGRLRPALVAADEPEAPGSGGPPVSGAEWRTESPAGS